MRGFISWLKSNNHEYHLLDTTGRAAKILSDLTQEKAQTIHGAIYRYKGLSGDEHGMHNPEKMFVQFLLVQANHSTQHIYIVDEASMLASLTEEHNSFARYGSGNLLQDLLNYDRKGKFIFIGDPCQLPPVRQKFSPALSSEYLSSTFGIKVREIELTQIVRQDASGGIAQTSMHLRKYYYRNPPDKFPKIPLKGHSDIELATSNAELILKYEDLVCEKGDAYATMICQSNRQCSLINQMVRNRLYRRPKNIEIGYLLLITQNNLISGLLNGDLVNVKHKGKLKHRAGIAFREMEVTRQGEDIVYRNLIIEDVLINGSTNLSSEQYNNLMSDFMRRAKKLGMKASDSALEATLRKDPFMNALKAVYGYAITCHKSQGGEWNEIFLYMDNKMYGIPRPVLFQWWYTAITRAKYTLHAAKDWYVS